MYVPRQTSKLLQRKENHADKSLRKLAASKKKKDALFELDTYLLNQDYVGALALLCIQSQQPAQHDSGDDSRLGGLAFWMRNTWWVAYCQFQCGNFEVALEHFEQLLQSYEKGEQVASTTKFEDLWRLSSACCLYYLHRFEEAEQRALSTTRHSLCNRLLFLVAHRRNHGDQVLLDRYQQLTRASKEDQLAMAFVGFLRRNFQEAIDIYKQLLIDYRDQVTTVQVYLAMCYFKLDYYDVSLELLVAYLEGHPESFVATNLKACNQYRRYSGYEAKEELEGFIQRHPSHPCAQEGGMDATGIKDVVDHNMVVFQEMSGIAERRSSVSVLKPLIGSIEEARINLAIVYLNKREYQLAFELVEDLEPMTPTEYIVKAILHGIIGEQTNSKDHVFLAEKYFHAIGASSEDCDTIPGRQCMASYYILRKEFDQANVYLESIESYLNSSDAFNWNYGISLASCGKYNEAQEVLFRVQSPVMKTQLVWCSWLARCYIYINKGSAGLAWKLYLKMENTSDAFELLKLIANDYYKTKNFYFAVKAFDVLERLDPDPEYWEAKRGACVGYCHQLATGGEPLNAHRCEEVLRLLAGSKNALEASKLSVILRKWTLSLGLK